MIQEQQRLPELRLALADDEIAVDNFAGGGGASTGMDDVLAEYGRHVTIAINHDAQAIAMHKMNHPQAEHYVDDVFEIDIVRAVRGRRIGFAWYSPDCTFHSKARGGKPFRDRNRARRIRGLAWVIHKHVKQLRDAGDLHPRVIAMENVQEFADWGPLDDEGKIIAIKKGFTFRRWCRQLQNLGYQIDMWELKGCDYGAPTTRERLFIVARRDGVTIRKPEPTHGPGRALPYRTAAECIDFALPCPSIFTRKRPLAENTLRRIAEGIRRYVLENPKPFIVPVAHQGDARVNSIDEPLRTTTADRRGDFAVVQPLVVGIDNKSNGGRDVWPADEPVRTITLENRFALATPLIVRCAHGERDANGKKRGRGHHQAELPLPTQTGSNDFAVVTPLIVGVGGRRGQSPACSVERPAPTCTAKADAALVEPFLVRYHGQRRPGEIPRVEGVDGPLPTQTAENRFGLVAPILVPRYGERPGEDGAPGQAPRARSVQLPLPTIVTTDNGAQLVAATLLKQNGVDEKMVVGQDMREPMHSITTRDQKAVMTSHLLKFKGTSKDGQPVDQPLHTIQAGGLHYAEVRALLLKFYSTGGQWGDLHDPLGAVTSKDRFGLVTVMIAGEEYAIVDIGLRMLTPRELFRAQGFPDSYEIEGTLDGDLTKTAQVRMCGNSVCPPVASAIVRSQLVEEVCA